MPPPNIYFIHYSIRSFWDKHCVYAVIGKKQYGQRLTAYLPVPTRIWIHIDATSPRSSLKIRVPLGSPEESVSSEAQFCLRLVVTVVVTVCAVLAWVVVIDVRRRKEI